MTLNRNKDLQPLPPYPSENSDPDEPPSNRSDNPSFDSILERRMSRREVLTGSLNSVVAAIMLGWSGGALADRSRFLPPQAGGRPPFANDPVLGFDAIPTSTAVGVTVPPGYRAEPFVPWGTPICYVDGRWPVYEPNGGNSGAEQECQVGYNHDGMHYFPLHQGPRGSAHGLLCINHEFVNANDLHPNGPTLGPDNTRLVPDEVRKEVAAHGVSVIEIKKRSHDGGWQVVQGSHFNRRITAGTPMELSGPVRGSDLVKTRFSPDGTRTRGTVNNCAYGFTPWGTYLTCEENFQNYFVGSDPQPREQARYGIEGIPRFPLYWWTVDDDLYVRWDARLRRDGPTEDYRNEPNTFGWVVEIDPFDPDATPRKRTALGRIRHEGAWVAPAQRGQPITVYMGDDQRFEYIYKFVSRGRYFPETADGDLLDDGTLYVARFNADGSGEWMALDINDPAFRHAVDDAVATGKLERGFADQADVLVNARSAADAVGATRMDRPEWGAVDPQTHEVYMTLTNNSRRAPDDTNPANPRGPNPYGQIIRWREHGNRNWATRFDWELFVVAGPQDDSRTLDGDSLDEGNVFNSPDGLWFDHNGILWIQTDGSDAPPFGNNQMLAADPRSGEIRRFFTGATDSEVTGVDITPDGRTMFVNVQHPGADWPDGGGARPRSSTVIVTREDGGTVAVADQEEDRDPGNRFGRDENHGRSQRRRNDG